MWLLPLVLLILIGAAIARAGSRYDTARRLNVALRGTPMSRLGYELESAGWRNHVHPALMAAIAATESSLGVAACPGNRFNVWGLGSCGSAWAPPRFTSWRQAIGYFARFLRRTWPRARTPFELYGYAADVQGSWAPSVAGWMRRWGFPAVAGYGP